MADPLMLVPEVVLFDIVRNGIEYLRRDYAAQTDKSKSYLMTILQSQVLERYDFQTQAIEVFINNDETNQRYLEVNMMFNMEREGLPTIHLTLPSEQTQTGGNGIGVDEGYMDSIIEDTEYDAEGNMTFQGSITPVFTRRFQSTYNIVITSDNSNEVILIYHVLRSLMISMIPSISLAGLENVALGGQDVQLYSGLAPKNMYIRAITFTCQYETSVPNIFSQPIFHNLIIHGTPVLE